MNNIVDDLANNEYNVTPFNEISLLILLSAIADNKVVNTTLHIGTIVS